MTKSITRFIIASFYYATIYYKSKQEDMNLLRYYKHLYMNYEHSVRGRFLPSSDKVISFMKGLTGTSSLGRAGSGSSGSSKNRSENGKVTTNNRETTNNSNTSVKNSISDDESNHGKDNTKGSSRLFP